MKKHLFLIICFILTGVTFPLAGDQKGKIAKPDNKQKQKTFQGAPPLPPIKPEVILHCSRKLPLLALTFDACELKCRKFGYDKRIINILLKTGTPATLFLGGKWMQSHEKETRFLSGIPLFELANHSHTHPDMRKLSKKGIRYQIKKTQDIMYRITGSQGTLFRAPFGYYNRQVLKLAGEAGLSVIQWDVVSGDPDPKVSAAMIKRFVLKGARSGSIIIMHMNRQGHNTHKILEEIIVTLRRRGYRFVTVSKLMAGGQ